MGKMVKMKHGARWLSDPKMPTRQRLLLMLKLGGEATAKELADRLHMSVMGVRRHLYALAREGLVTHRVVRGRPGRPQHRYALTAAGHAWFGEAYAPLSVELLTHLKEMYGAEAVKALFARRSERRISHARQVIDHKPVAERGSALAELLSAEGYLAEWQPEGDNTFVLCEHHCAIREVAQAFPEACSSELTFIQAIFPEARVERVAHMREGDLFCAYRVHLEHQEALCE